MKVIFSLLIVLMMLATSMAATTYASEEGVLKMNDKRFYLKGTSWFGFETGVSVAHGLWAVDYKFIVDFMA